MNWYKKEGSPSAYDEYFDKWLPQTQRQAENPWPYKIVMVKKTKGLILDAGCGVGILCRFIQNGVFLDFSRVCLKKRWVGGERPRVLASVEDMPFRNEVFDSVIATEVMEHTDNPKKFVGEVHRVLKNSGFFTWSSPWQDSSPTHHFKVITRGMIDKWLKPPFQDYTFDVPPKKKGRFIVYACK